MARHINRRDMMKSSTAAAAGLWITTRTQPARAKGANEKLDIAFIGIGGQGRSNLNGLRGENVVALCDVDEKQAGNAFDRWGKARKFHDFRRMLDKMDKQIDAVVVSTPDHTHFHPSMMAMQMGKHLYCEKPMAHTVWEARQMIDLAREKKLATQLGVQRHTHGNMHRVVELIQAGAIGQVEEVHAWIGGNRGMPGIPTDKPPVPDHLKWDLWLGPARPRPYHPSIAPYGWRFWWDYGTGEMGNWGCHILDIPFWALGLEYPTRVDASGPPIHELNTPKQMQTRFEFPAIGKRGPVTLHWHHASNGPPVLRERGLSAKGSNNLFIGTKGMLLCGFGSRKLLPAEKFADFEPPPKTVPDSPGFHREWIDACKGGTPATCHFDYSGPMAETVLLGNAAYRAGGGFDWHAETLKASGNPKADRFLRPQFPKGWEA